MTHVALGSIALLVAAYLVPIGWGQAALLARIVKLDDQAYTIRSEHGFLGVRP